MEREIKFRGLEATNKSGKWIYGSLVTGNNYTKGYAGIISEKGSLSELLFSEGVVDIDTVGQYTGLKDKNGKEIYEGDVIEFGGERYLEYFRALIRYRDDRFIAEWTGDVFFKEDVCFWTTERIVQVIGNIYENPNLLQEEHQK